MRNTTSVFFTCSIEQWANREIGGEIPEAWTRKRRRRKVTLASAIKEAQEAGVMQGRVTVNGVTVEYGQASSLPCKDDVNPWDEVLPNVTH